MTIFFLAVVILFSLLNGTVILNRMYAKHQSTWIELGQPTVTLSSGVRPRLALAWYIWRHRFLELNDPPLSIACLMAMIAEILIMGLSARILLGS